MIFPDINEIQIAMDSPNGVPDRRVTYGNRHEQTTNHLSYTSLFHIYLSFPIPS